MVGRSIHTIGHFSSNYWDESAFAHLAIVDDAIRREVEEVIADAEAYTELIEQFLVDGNLWRDRLETAFVERDVAGVRRACHTWKGSCATMGVVRLTEILAHVENSAQARHLDRILIPQLRSEWGTVRTYFRDWLQQVDLP